MSAPAAHFNNCNKALLSFGFNLCSSVCGPKKFESTLQNVLTQSTRFDCYRLRLSLAHLR